MRICLVAHGFPPLERTGVETYTASLAAALARRGHVVEVFVPRVAPQLPEHSLRREERDGYGLTWLTTNHAPEDPEQQLDRPGAAARFAEFLEQQQPELVHFQHLIKLGTSLVQTARRHGAAVLYTAHDAYAFCHRYTWMRPDLERCGALGDSRACARCDMALGMLNQQAGLGDYQIGVLPHQLEPQVQERLRLLLAGDPLGAGFEPTRVEQMETARAALDRKRLRAMKEFELVFAPSHFLAQALVQAGLEPERVVELGYGVECSDLERLQRPERAPGEALRLGYLGGLSKHKGVHLLIGAFQRLEQPARLEIHGTTSDQAYRSWLEELARRTPAHLELVFAGPYGRPQLPRVLAGLHAIVVPSTWVENYPISIREAFAARRPVLASRVGALPESVCHERDGLLFEVGDESALAAALWRLQQEDGLYERLVAGIGPVKGMQAHVLELETHYTSLCAQRARRTGPDSRLPQSLLAFQERHARLRALSTRELYELALAGLDQFAGQSLPELTPADPAARMGALLLRALPQMPRSQLRLRDAQNQVSWLQGVLEGERQAQRALAERLSWREEELKQRREEVDWQRDLLDDVKRARSTLEQERDWLKSQSEAQGQELHWHKQTLDKLQVARDSLEHERDWLQKQKEDQVQELDWLRQGLEDAKLARVSLERERDWLSEQARAHELEVRQLNERLLGNQRELSDLHGLLSKREAELLDFNARVLESERRLEVLAPELVRQERAVTHLRGEVRAREQALALLNREVSTEREVRGRELQLLQAELATHEQELGLLVAKLDSVRLDAHATRSQLEAQQRELVVKREEVQDLRRGLADLDAHSEALRSNLENERERLRERLRQAASISLEALRAQQQVVLSEILPLLVEIERCVRLQKPELAGQPFELREILPGRDLASLSLAVKKALESVQALEVEAGWRRQEMTDAIGYLKRGLARSVLMRTGLGRRIHAWDLGFNPWT